jgi:ubiquinone/menaquinone biosynthesis C-methylase UbiE
VVVRLHIGCDTNNFGKDWKHIDWNKYPHVDSTDMTTLPFKDGTVDFIYAPHVMQYFGGDDLIDLMREYFRVMKNGSKLRVSVPDFKAINSLYKDRSKKSDLNLLHDLITCPKVVEDSFTASGYKFIYSRSMYDPKYLRYILRRCGFRQIKSWDWRKTRHGNIWSDSSQSYVPATDKVNGTLISLNMECLK